MMRALPYLSARTAQWGVGLPSRLLSSHSSDHSEVDAAPQAPSLKSWYLNFGHFPSADGLVSQLAGEVIYQSEPDDPNGVVAFNKPAGLAKAGPISVEALAQPLADRLGLARLIPIKCPERHTSGVALMATNEKSQQRVLKLLRGARNSTFLPHNYHVLTNNFPRLDGEADLVEQSIVLIGNRNAQKHGTHKEPIISRSMTSRSRKGALRKKRIDPPEKIRVYVQCLAKSGLGPAALVSVQPSKVRSMFLRVYMNDLLAPIIGDHNFSYRSRSVMGVMTKVSHKQSPPYHPVQSFPRWIMERIGLNKGEEGLVPCMIHLTRVAVPHFFKKDEHLLLFAPYPNCFSRTAQALGIALKPQEWNDLDQPLYHKVEMGKRSD